MSPTKPFYIVKTKMKQKELNTIIDFIIAPLTHQYMQYQQPQQNKLKKLTNKIYFKIKNYITILKTRILPI